MNNHLIIVNPVSGRGTGERSIPALSQWLDEHQIAYDLVRTERPGHAIEIARQGAVDGYQVVVAVGGDGTANEVLNGLMLAREAGVEGVAMGVIGLGRGNDFAYGVGIPAGLEPGCHILAQDRRRAIDVGRVVGGLYPQGRYFGNGIGVGFDAVVGFEAAKMKRLRGFISYLVAALKTVFLYYRAPLARIEYGDQTITQPALMVSVMNGRRMGGSFMMAPRASASDGMLDLCIARQVSRLRILALIPVFMKGTQADQPSVTIGRAQRVVVTAVEGVLPAHADGETLCTDGQQLTIELAPRCIDLVCAPWEEAK